jgi:hypothetical protein
LTTAWCEGKAQKEKRATSARLKNSYNGLSSVLNAAAEDELASEVLGVTLGEVLPLFRQIVHGEDGRDWTDWDASTTVDALNGIDVEHFLRAVGGFVLLGMNAIDRTSIHTSGVLGSDTWFCDHVSHNVLEILFSEVKTHLQTPDCSKRAERMFGQVEFAATCAGH